MYEIKSVNGINLTRLINEHLSKIFEKKKFKMVFVVINVVAFSN